MASNGTLNPESEDFAQPEPHQYRPIFWYGQHDSARVDALTDAQYEQVLNAGVSEPLVSWYPRANVAR